MNFQKNTFSSLIGFIGLSDGPSLLDSTWHCLIQKVAKAGQLTALVLLFSCLYLTTHAQWTNGQDAFWVIGQPDFDTNTQNNGGISAQSLYQPGDIALDLINGKMYVVDVDNLRILRYAYPITSNQPTAELVFGQADFTSGSFQGTAQNTFSSFIAGVFVDASGRLWVADANSNRVLWFNDAHAINTNQPNADGVLGQADFTSNQANRGGSIAANTMNNPNDVFVDANGALWVADDNNERVLLFDNVASKGNGADADGLLGQEDFGIEGDNLNANGFDDPEGIIGDGAGNLWVADEGYHRITRFDDAVSKATGGPANEVLGQANFFSGTANRGGLTAANTLNQPRGLALDGKGNLYVADIENHRVLVYLNGLSKTNGADADFVLGQASFTDNSLGISINKLNLSNSFLTVDSENGILWVADRINNRVVGYQASARINYPTLTIAKNADGAEDATDGTFTVTTSEQFSTNTTVNISIAGTASEGTDFANIGTSFSFPANSSTATITVDVSADTDVEGDETVLVTLAGGTGYELGSPSNATVTITDNEFPSLSIAATTPASEDATDGLFTVTTSDQISTAITVNITIGGSATNGTDLATIPTTFTFPANSTDTTILVDVTADAIREGSETVIVTLVENVSSKYTVGTPSSATVTISDNDVVYTIESGNELMFGDPCSCDDLRNCEVGGTTFFHDTLTVTTGGVSGLNITAATGATDFYTAMPCFGGTLTLIPSGTTIPETPAGSGVYKIEFWKPLGVTPTLSVVESGVTTPVPTSTFQPICTTETCNPSAPIPTMSQWGLLIFGLLIMNLSVFFVQGKELN